MVFQNKATNLLKPVGKEGNISLTNVKESFKKTQNNSSKKYFPKQKKYNNKMNKSSYKQRNFFKQDPSVKNFIYFKHYRYFLKRNKNKRYFFKRRLLKVLNFKYYRLQKRYLYLLKKLNKRPVSSIKNRMKQKKFLLKVLKARRNRVFKFARHMHRCRKYKYNNRFSTWLKYFVYYWKNRIKKELTEYDGDANYINVKQTLNNQKETKNKWLAFIKNYKALRKYFPKNNVYLPYALLMEVANKKYGRFPKGFILTKFYRKKYRFQRHLLDNETKQVFFKRRFLYKNLFWVYKSFIEKKRTKILWNDYYWVRGYAPYIFVQKKNKLFYNWCDKHIFKRYPIARYKYNLLYKFPRFADYRRLFKNQLREQHLFRWIYRLKFSQLVKIFRKSTYNTKRSFELMFLKHFEFRLDTIVYRLNFAYSLRHARQLVNRGLFLVNNKIVDNFRYHVVLGDVIMPIKEVRMTGSSKRVIVHNTTGVVITSLRLFWRQIQADQYPEYVMLNERIPAGMIVSNVNPNNLRFNKPFSIQFLTLSLLKYS